MLKSRLNHTTILGSLLAIGMGVPDAARAQQAQSDAAGAATANAPADAAQAVPASPAATASGDSARMPGQEIVVTGSRIRRPNIDSPAPIASIGQDQFFNTGNTNIGDRLSQLSPELHSSFNSSNSTQYIGTQGLNVLDLRGLGTQRTLTLINGRRQVTSSLAITGTEVDVNTIPTDLIERIDIQTGGSSSVYGSDAIAGVVNFVLKQNYQGLQFHGQNGLSSHGDAGNHYLSMLAGRNFGDGRGNIAVAVEYAKQDALLASDRAHYRQQSGFVQTERDPAGLPNGSDGIPDYTFFRGFTSGVYSNGGTIQDFSTTPYTPYIFQPDGTLIQQTGTRIGVNQRSFLNSNGGATFVDGDQVYLTPSNMRLIGNVLAHYDVSDAFKPYFEGKYAHTRVIGTQSGPSFTNQGSLGDVFHTDNPFLTTQALGVIRSVFPDADTDGFVINRNNLDLGSRVDDTRRNLWRIVAGARGDVATNLNYDISVNYSHFHEKNYNHGNLDVQRYLLAIDAVRDPASGNIVCRSRLDPSSASALPGGEGFLASDIAGCVPLNLFGDGVSSAAARAYVNPITTSVARADQLDIVGSINYNTGAFLNLPGGPIAFAFGGEYRRETQYKAFDALVTSGVTFSNAIPVYDPPALRLYEGFGEIEIPVFRDRPFAHKLLLNSAFRVSHYEAATGTVVSYNGGGQYAPIRDITFRANFSRAVRAPALSESYGAISQNFATVTDPCAANQIGEGTTTRAANCAAAGIPASFNYVYNGSLEIQSGGNPGLKAETSDSLTVGAVLTPTFLPGFTASIDYYTITVDNVISAPAAQDILDACYDAASLANQFCALFQRDNAAGTQTGTAYRIIEGSLQQTLLNYAKLKVRGIDAEVAYTRNIDGFNVSIDLKATRNIQNDQYLFPNDPNRPDQLLEELSYPKWQGVGNFSIRKGAVRLGYQLRYIGRASIAAIENIRSVGGRPPQNADYASFEFYKPAWYHDVTIGFDVTDKLNVYGGVNNVTDRYPPYYRQGIGGTYNDGIYDNRGRYLFVGVTAKY